MKALMYAATIDSICAVCGMYALNHFFPVTVPITFEVWFMLALGRQFIKN